ncbi:MAG: hypothetical protein ACSHXY_08340 [Alphaproteobacteria bacterium]
MSLSTRTVWLRPFLSLGDNWNRTLFTASIVALAVFPLLIGINLHRGLDMTDSAFYLLSISENAQVYATTTQFGTVWGLFPFRENVLLLRWSNFLLLCTAGGFATTSVFKLFHTDTPHQIISTIFLSLWGAGSTLLFYSFWLPDPSYNTLALALNLGLITAASHIIHNLRNDHSSLWSIVLAGAMVFALGLTRPPSALFTGVTLVFLVLLLGRPSWNKVLRLMILSVVGAVLMIILLSVIVEPIWTTLGRMQAGVAASAEIGNSTPAAIKWADMQGRIFGVWKDNWLWISLLSTIGLHLPATKRGRKAIATKWALYTLAVLGLLGLMAPLLHKLREDKVATLYDMSEPLCSLLTAALIIAIIRIVFAFKWPNRQPAVTTFFTVIAIVPIILGQVFGTGNSWFPFAGLYAILPLLMFGFILCSVEKDFKFNPMIGALVVVTLVFQATVWVRASQSPYRLNGTLADQTIRTSIRAGRSHLSLDKATHDFLTQLEVVRPKLDALPERPLLIDLSGITPLTAYHLDMDIPGTPWLLGGYEWSAKLLEFQVDKIETDRLCRAWILLSENSSGAIDPAPLIRRGLDLSNGYKTELIVATPYKSVPVQLVSPLRTNKECSELQAHFIDE